MKIIISEEEKRQLETIRDILIMAECDLFDMGDDVKDTDIKETCRRNEEWIRRAEDTLSAILNDDFDKSQHDLSMFELPK